MVRILASILELNYVILDIVLCFLAPHIYSVDNTIRHQEASRFPTFQDSAGHKKNGQYH